MPVRMAVCLGVIFHSIDGNDPAVGQQPADWAGTEQLNRTDKVDLARYRCPDDESVGQGVGMIGSKEHRTRQGDALAMESLNPPKVDA